MRPNKEIFQHSFGIYPYNILYNCFHFIKQNIKVHAYLK